MRKYVTAAAIAAFFLIVGPGAWPPGAWADTAPAKKHEEMLYTVTMIDTGTSRGSGTVIYSAERDGGWATYVLTNFHVVDNAIKIVEEWDPDQGKEVKKETRDPVTVNWFRYNDYSRNVGTTGREATIEAYDRTADLALLKLVDRESGAAWVAALFPEYETAHLFDETFAVGAGMGKPPFATNGLIA